MKYTEFVTSQPHNLPDWAPVNFMIICDKVHPMYMGCNGPLHLFRGFVSYAAHEVADMLSALSGLVMRPGPGAKEA